MSPYIAKTNEAHSQFAGMAEMFNGGDIDRFVALHSEDVVFSTPMWRSRYGDQWGEGIAAFRRDVLGYRRAFGRLLVDSVFPVGSSVAVLAHDESGNRTEFCIGIGPAGLVTSVFAFHVKPRRALAMPTQGRSSPWLHPSPAPSAARS